MPSHTRFCKKPHTAAREAASVEEKPTLQAAELFLNTLTISATNYRLSK
jgi:hypothetical protein